MKERWSSISPENKEKVFRFLLKHSDVDDPENLFTSDQLTHIIGGYYLPTFFSFWFSLLEPVLSLCFPSLFYSFAHMVVIWKEDLPIEVQHALMKNIGYYGTFPNIHEHCDITLQGITNLLLGYNLLFLFCFMLSNHA
jgi:hypothetical protein